MSVALLSFLWPGLGQLILGRWRIALLLALPPLALVAYGAYQLANAPESSALRLLVPSVASAVIILIAAHGLWRVLSVVHAWRASATVPARRDRALPLVLVLCLVMAGGHAFAVYYVQSYSVAARPIFGAGTGQPAPPAPAPPGGPVVEQPNDPAETPPGFLDDLIGEELPVSELSGALDPGPGIPLDGPLAVLFVGVDSGPGRDHALTDVLMVGAIDRQRNELALINVPRDTGHFPLYKGGVYPDRVNSFLSHARNNPEQYPEGALRALANQMAFLVGVPIHYYIVLDMAGFERIVDMVGGVTVQIDYSIADPLRRLYLEPGRHYLDGTQTLSFVRSRHGPNNSDYRRAQRQQQVMRALAQRMRDPTVAVRLPEISRAAANMARTNVPVDSLTQLLDLIEAVDDATPTRVVLQPQKYAQRIPRERTGGRFMTELKMDAVAALSIELFGEYSLYGRDTEEGERSDSLPNQGN